MEVSEEQRKESASYTYWVREVTGDAAPLPVPRKLSSEDISGLSHPPNLGSVWNRVFFPLLFLILLLRLVYFGLFLLYY